jgi:hypothetical protein
VVRGENLTGTLQFSTTEGSGPTPTTSTTTGNTTTSIPAIGGVGSTGVAVIYYDGDTYLGNSQGALNSQASTMTVNFQADAQGQGQQNITISKEVTNTTTSNGTTTTEQTAIPSKQILYFDCLYLDGFANCKTSSSFPNQKFDGSGEAQFQQLDFSSSTPVLDAVTLPISVTGVRLSNTAASFNVSDVQHPSVNNFTILE